jgi:hypothetical protein
MPSANLTCERTCAFGRLLSLSRYLLFRTSQYKSSLQSTYTLTHLHTFTTLHINIHTYIPTPILPYSHTPILPYSHTPILPYSHTPILPYSQPPPPSARPTQPNPKKIFWLLIHLRIHITPDNPDNPTATSILRNGLATSQLHPKPLRPHPRLSPAGTQSLAHQNHWSIRT